MYCPHPEPSLSEALTDPIIEAMMKADGVDPKALEAELRNMARKMSGRQRPQRLT
jgi:hypothetical protein